MSAFVAFVVAVPISAIDPDAMTPQEYTIIESKCRTAQGIIQRIEYVDPVVRVNRGTVYNSLSKLMTAMTSRAAYNAYSVASFADETRAVQDQRSQFAKDYTDYEISLREVINIDCVHDPQGFYRKLVDVRSKRAVVALRVREIERHLDVFSDAIKQLETQLKARVQ